MSELPWVRLDTAFPFNPKVQALVSERDGHRAVAVYVCGLAFAGLNGTDGFIPKHSLPSIYGRTADAQRLVAHNFWVPTQGGWDINGWAEKQPSTEEHARRKARAKAAADKRWGNTAGGDDAAA